MHQIDFQKLKNRYGYNIYQKYLNKSIELDKLIVATGVAISAIDTGFPATVEMKKWLSLMKK